jgi:hypothetical protein
VQVDSVLVATAYISNVIIKVSELPGENGAVYNSGPGKLVMNNVRTRSRYGVNNASGRIEISNSDIDGVVQNGAGGIITVQDSDIGEATPLPESGATAYSSGKIVLTRVKIYSTSVGIYAVDPGSRIEVVDSQILSTYPRQALLTGTTVCANVTKNGGESLNSSCT